MLWRDLMAGWTICMTHYSTSRWHACFVFICDFRPTLRGYKRFALWNCRGNWLRTITKKWSLSESVHPSLFFHFIILEYLFSCCKTKLIYLQNRPRSAGTSLTFSVSNFCPMICFHFLPSFENTFKLNYEPDSNLKAQQMCIISCSLWKGKRVDIEHWSLKLQFCCSIIHDTTEWYILARGPCGQRPPVRAASPSLLCCWESYSIIECKCSVNDRHLRTFTMI